jgi:hypothetical protein
LAEDERNEYEERGASDESRESLPAARGNWGRGNPGGAERRAALGAEAIARYSGVTAGVALHVAQRRTASGTKAPARRLTAARATDFSGSFGHNAI